MDQPIISVIDDDASLRRAIVALVRSLGHIAHGFASAEEFLDAEADTRSDCIITDIQMPECDGLELLEALRYRRDAPKVIAMSGAWDGVCLPSASRLGAFAAIHKPWRKQEILDLIRSAFREETVAA